MKKIIMVIFGILLLSVVLVSANGDHQSEIEEGKKLVESKVNCDKLSDEQLETIGEYYMEQMHPGEAHEAMHEMMGMEEGTEYHQQVHVNMARMMYCGEGGMMGSGGMMGMMQGMMGDGNMMGSGGMMNMMGTNMMGSGMMGNYPTYYGYNNFWNILWLIFLIVIIVLIIWLIYNFTKKGKESETPINILQKRYAKGEINKKQFDEMKKELKGR